MFKEINILFIAVVVLGFASISNAALYLSVDGVVEPNGPVVLEPNETVAIGVWGDGNTPPYCFYLGLEAGSGGTIDICDANMLYGGNMTSIEMVDDIEGAELLDVNNPFVAMEFIDLVMPPDDPLPLNGQLVDNITVTGPGTLLLFDGEGNPAGVDEPNDFMGQSLVGEITAEIAEMPSEAMSRPSAITRTTHLVYCPPEPNVPFDSNSVGGLGDIIMTMAADFAGGSMPLTEPPTPVDIYDDITSNTIWTADHIYQINGVINVQALLVIQPGTEICCNSASSLHINNGGTLISCGTPESRISYGSYTESGYMSPALYLESTASPATKITYSDFLTCGDAITVNNIRLDDPIENNVFWGPVFGINEFGPNLTDIVNNIFGYTGYPIVLHIADANSHILIENNTLGGPVIGIEVYGAADANNAGHIMIADNVITQAYYYGLRFFDCTWVGLYNTGYYKNGTADGCCDCGNVSPVGFGQVNPIEPIINPFVVVQYEGYPPAWYLDCLAPGSAFIDAGTQYIEDTHLMAKTDDFNGVPDDDLVNLGYHYEYCLWGVGEYVNAGVGVAAGDINKDAATDWPDLQLLTHDWLHCGGDEANDLNNDYCVNLKDFAILAQTWYKIQGHPDIRPVISGDVNNLNGSVDVNVVNFGPWAWRGFVLMDGQFIREIVGFNDADAGVVRLDSREYNNGQHTIKAATVDYSGLVTVSDKVEVNFSNELYCVSKPDSFEEGKDYQISAMFSESNDLRVKLVDWDGTPKWTSSTISGDVNNVTIPHSEFTKQIYDVAVEKYGGANWQNIYQQAIGKYFNPKVAYRFAIFLPENKNKRGQDIDDRKRTVAEIVSTCQAYGKEYVVLYRGQCTWDNFIVVMAKPSIKYAYMSAHGNWRYGDIQRTSFLLTGSTVLSYWSPGLPPESGSIHYMEDLGLEGSEQMKIVHIDACYSAKFDDMAWEWMNCNEVPILGQIYIGWKDLAYMDDDWDIFSKNIWYGLARGDNFYWALHYALSQNYDPDIPLAFRYIGDDQICFP